MWNCVICKKPLDCGETSTVKKKGLETLTTVSEARQDGLANTFASSTSLNVHLRCRIEYTRPHSIKKAAREQEGKETGADEHGQPTKPTLRSSVEPFDFKKDCLFCGKEASYRKEIKKTFKYRRVIHEISTLPVKKGIRRRAIDRGDEWGNIVCARVDSNIDLVAAEAKYHKECHLRFLSGGRSEADDAGVGSGRRTDADKHKAFRQLCEFLEESEDCQFSLTDLQEYMEKKCEEAGCFPYSRVYLKEKLMDHYGRRISITELPGKRSIVNFKETADNVLYDKWYEERGTSETDERRRIVEKATQIIKEDIRARAYELGQYPPADESSLNANMLPDTLALFLEKIIATKSKDSSGVATKRKALGQAIISACRPNSFVSPILLSVGVYIHRRHGSRQLVELLHKMGFSVSYNEVLRYENSVIAHTTNHNDLSDHDHNEEDNPNLGDGLDLDGDLGLGDDPALCEDLDFDEEFDLSEDLNLSEELNLSEDLNLGEDLDLNRSLDLVEGVGLTGEDTVIKEFVQFSFDHTDGDVRTKTGHGTFHNMGGIRMSTPSPTLPAEAVPRLLNVTASAVTSNRGYMNITWYQKPIQSGLKKVIAKKLEFTTNDAEMVLKHAREIDILLLSGTWSGVPNPVSWSGYMKSALNGEMACDQSHVDTLPFINLSPSDPSAIYSALLFASKECSKRGQKICPVTFDQPLFIKAVDIVAAERASLSNVVVRLGGFHMIMAFMGAIGFIMSGSGIETLWEQVYAKGSVVHMVTGHAFSRALRAHFLTQQALGTMMLQLCSTLDSAFKENVSALHSSFLRDRDLTESEISRDPIIKSLATALDSKMQELSSLGRTARLWLQYYELVEILRFFIRAERTGDWDMHLAVVQKMIPFFHAGGRLHYAKASHLYLQGMHDLEETTCLQEFRKFAYSGYFTIRRSHEFWSGVWSDQVIEQDLMRPFKSQGGLTHGRGITESTLAHYIYAFPECMKLCNAVETLCGMASSTTEPHVELLDSRRSCDCRDLRVFLAWLEKHSPFSPSENLHSLGTGILADGKVNCDNAFEVGQRGVCEMVGKSFADVKISRKDRVVPLSAMNGTVTIRDEITPVNTSQLFMRIVCILKQETEKAEYFHYELAATPPSLFAGCVMRKSDKAKFATLFQHSEVSRLPPNSIYVVDGGYLLHAACWPSLATYGEICDIYVRFVVTRYPSAVVVFDGYDGGLSTKDAEQRRRSVKRTCFDVEITEHTTSTGSQADFLSNKKNKSKLIEVLKAKFQNKGVPVRQAEGDADALIVETALESEKAGHSVVVVGNDTDLLAMLVARRQSGALFVLHPATSKSSGKLFDVAKIQEEIGVMKDAVLFSHAISGGDKTSSIYGKGKLKPYKLLERNDDLRKEVVDTFCSPSATREEVISVGEKFVRALYPGGTASKDIDVLRHRLYKVTIARQAVTAKFELASLPPTKAALQQHSMRTYLQVQEWLGRPLNPTDWGWQIIDNTLLPVPTTLPPAPDSLLLLIACDCKSGCGSRCGCRRSGQECSDMCSTCHGQECSNAIRYFETENDPDSPNAI